MSLEKFSLLNKWSTPSAETIYPYTPLIVVLLLGLALRVWGITFGFPHIYHVDEHFEVYRALRLGMGDFVFDRIVKGGYFYVLFAEYAIFYILLLITGTIHSSQEFAYSIVEDPSAIWTIGRATTAVIGTMNLYVVYLIGRRIHSHAVGVFASLLLAVSFMHVVHSHYITVDVPMTLLVSITLYYSIRIFQTGSRGDYLKAGIFAGLAAMFKLPGIIVVVPITIAHFLNMRHRCKPILSWEFAKHAGICMAPLVLLYVLGNPGVLLFGKRIVGGLIATIFGGTSPTNLPVETGKNMNHWLYYLKSLIEAVGVPLFVCGAFGIIKSFYGKRPEYLILAVYILSYFIAISLVGDPNLIYSRYVLPILPPMLLLAGIMVSDSVSYLNITGVKKLTIAVVLLLILAIPTMLKSINYDIVRTKKDTRTMAKEWIDSNIPPKTKIFVEGNPEVLSALVIPLENTKENILKISNKLRTENPGKAMFLKMRVQVHKEPAYDLITVKHFEPYKDWDFYKNKGVKVVVRTGRYIPEKQLFFSTENSVLFSRIKFDQALHFDPDVKLVAVFDQVELKRPGRYVRIYQVVNQT